MAMAARGVTATARNSGVLAVQVECETSALRAADLLGVVFPPGRIVATDGMGKVGVGRQQRMAERLPEQHGSLSFPVGQTLAWVIGWAWLKPRNSTVA